MDDRTGMRHSEESRSRMSHVASDEERKNASERVKGKQLNPAVTNKGEGHPAHGTMWITNGVNNARIKKTNPIPEGWRKGKS